MSQMWPFLERLPGLLAVPAVWREGLGPGHADFMSAFLRRASAVARSYPCPHGCGCAHEIVRHANGKIVAVCRCESWNCDDLVLTPEDVVLLELNWSKLGRSIAGAFDCDAKDDGLGLAGTRQVAAYGSNALPVVLSIQHDRFEFRSVVGQLAARLRSGFVLLAPTNQFVDATAKELLANCRAGFLDLASHVSLTAQGNLHGRKRGAELFGHLLSEAPEPMPVDVARRAFQLIEQLDSEQVIKPPSVLAVFRLYCVKELTAERVARKCRCSKGTIINRLKLIREKTGMDPDELRRFSSHFDKIEDDVRGSKAAYVHRKRMIDDSPSAEEGE